jgi:hypothetical protein
VLVVGVLVIVELDGVGNERTAACVAVMRRRDERHETRVVVGRYIFVALCYFFFDWNKVSKQNKTSSGKYYR